MVLSLVALLRITIKKSLLVLFAKSLHADVEFVTMLNNIKVLTGLYSNCVIGFVGVGVKHRIRRGMGNRVELNYTYLWSSGCFLLLVVARSLYGHGGTPDCHTITFPGLCSTTTNTHFNICLLTSTVAVADEFHCDCAFRDYILHSHSCSCSCTWRYISTGKESRVSFNSSASGRGSIVEN